MPPFTLYCARLILHRLHVKDLSTYQAQGNGSAFVLKHYKMAKMKNLIAKYGFENVTGMPSLAGFRKVDYSKQPKNHIVYFNLDNQKIFQSKEKRIVNVNDRVAFGREEYQCVGSSVAWFGYDNVIVYFLKGTK